MTFFLLYLIIVSICFSETLNKIKRAIYLSKLAFKSLLMLKIFDSLTMLYESVNNLLYNQRINHFIIISYAAQPATGLLNSLPLLHFP